MCCVLCVEYFVYLCSLVCIRMFVCLSVYLKWWIKMCKLSAAKLHNTCNSKPCSWVIFVVRRTFSSPMTVHLWRCFQSLHRSTCAALQIDGRTVAIWYSTQLPAAGAVLSRQPVRGCTQEAVRRYDLRGAVSGAISRRFDVTASQRA